VSHLTADDIRKTNLDVYPGDFLEKKRKEIALENRGDESLFWQEYYTNFEVALSEAIYGQEIVELEHTGRYCVLSPIYSDSTIVAFDVGRSDATVATYYQIRNGKIMLIDYFVDYSGSPELHAKMVADSGYNIKHIVLPHDATQMKWGNVNAKSIFVRHLPYHLQGTVTVNPRISNLWVGIFMVKDNWRYLIINSNTCAPFFEKIKAYRKTYNKSKDEFGDAPEHGESSHYADSLREGIRFIVTRYGHLLNAEKLGYNKKEEYAQLDKAKIYRERKERLKLMIK
jgi:hypothetical protein